MQYGVTRQAALESLSPMADHPEGRFNRLAGPNALPVLGRKDMIENHQLLMIFVQTDGSLRILRLIGFVE